MVKEKEVGMDKKTEMNKINTELQKVKEILLNLKQEKAFDQILSGHFTYFSSKKDDFEQKNPFQTEHLSHEQNNYREGFGDAWKVKYIYERDDLQINSKSVYFDDLSQRLMDPLEFTNFL